MKITQKHLKTILHYDPTTGHFTWLPTPIRKKTLRTDKIRNTKHAGKFAGSFTDGYNRITIRVGEKYRYFRSARLAWLYMTGRWPENDIDHINLDRSDDRFLNLRPATRSQNNANSGPPKDNTSGKKGVHWDSARKKWKAEISKNGKSNYLGRFDSFEEACKVRAAYAQKIFGNFAKEN